MRLGFYAAIAVMCLATWLWTIPSILTGLGAWSNNDAASERATVVISK